MSKKLIAANQVLKQEGITDSLLAVGVFHPRGESGAESVGVGLGDVGGGGVVGSVAGTVMAKMARDAVGQTEGLPSRTFLGVGRRQLYVMAGDHPEWGRIPTKLLFAMDRSTLKTEIKQRAFVRIVVLQDTASGAVAQVECRRGLRRSSAVISSLVGA